MNATAKPGAAEASGGDIDPAAAAFADGWRQNLQAEIDRYTVIVADLHAAADRAADKHEATVATSEANRAEAERMAADGDAFLAELHAQLEGI